MDVERGDPSDSDDARLKVAQSIMKEMTREKDERR